MPAPGPNRFTADVPVGLDGARQQILERASPQHAGPMIADDVRPLVRFEVELLHRQPAMIAQRLAQLLPPGRRGGELHAPGHVVTPPPTAAAQGKEMSASECTGGGRTNKK